MGSWKTLLHPYYAWHSAAFFSYMILHHTKLTFASEDFRSRALKWEMQAVLCLMILLSIKYVRRTTKEAFLSDGVLYSKVFVASLAFMVDWRLFAWYLVIFAMLFLLCVQPSPLNEGKVLSLTPLQLENFLTEGNQNTCWLVEFGAVWSPRYVRLRELFSDISTKYSKSGVQFARIDLGRFPSAASRYDIDMGVAVRQIPTLIMFEGGLELCRLPERDTNGREAWSESYVVQKFGLDARLVQGLSLKVHLSYQFQSVNN